MALYAASSARIFLKSCRVFVNYAHFGKIRKIYAFTFYFKFGKNNISLTVQQTSKWQTHGAQEHKFPRWFADGIK